MLWAWMGSLSMPLRAQQFAHVDPLFFSKGYGGADPLPQVLAVTSTGSPIHFNVLASTSTGDHWLAVSTTGDCCVTPDPVSVTVNPSAALAAGSYSGQVVLTGGGTALVVNVTLVIVPSGEAVFDRTPSRFSFSLKPGGQAPSQVMQIRNGGTGALDWTLIGSTFNGANFLKASVQTGTAPTRITLGVLPENLPNGGATVGVYTGQLLFLAAGSIVTIPVSISVGDTDLDQMNPPRSGRAYPAARSTLFSGGGNLWPPNTINVVCGGFGNINTGYGGYTTAPDGTNTGQLIYEANPGNGAVPHYEYLYADLGVGQQTLSFHFKAGNNSWVYLRSLVDGIEQRVWFNLVGNGAVGTNLPAGWTAQIAPVGNGWYRCAVTFIVTQFATNSGFGLANFDQQVDYVATNGNGVYQWGQQFEHGTLSAYQANVGPCLDFTKNADANFVGVGSPIGYTIGFRNNAAPGTGAAIAAMLNDPLPGTGINWSISPAYNGPGTCAITGASGSQMLACNYGDVAGGGLTFVHITSGAPASSCTAYSNTATLSATNQGLLQASATTTVQCPGLSISKTHAGNLTQGQTGATYTVMVSEQVGTGPTFGTVTVTENLPAGLTLASMSGAGWTCPGTAANNCTRSDVLAAGASYPAITVTVNVASNAGSPLLNSVSVSGGGSPGASASDSTVINVPQPLRFVPLTPCRIADTRNANGPFGGPNLAGGISRDFNPAVSSCGIPANALAYSLNLTVVPLTPLGFFSIWPAGQSQPVVSTLNSFDGRIKANAAIVPAGVNGALTVYATDPTHLVVDINGYFVPASGSQNMAFYPVTPCRVADTRNSTATFGGPALAGGVPRTFPVPSSGCGIPAGAQAYAFNMTVVPTGALGFLSSWPAGSPQPLVSTLNALTGAVTSNAAIVPAGVNGAISVYATDTTDLIIDINGYFAPPGTGSLDFYRVTPCRVLDTRNAVGPLGGPIMGAGQARSFIVPSSACGIPAAAKAYSLNATVVPPAYLGFLALWGSGSMPLVSTLNSFDGTVVANAALVPAGASGEVTAYTTNLSHLILDINGYFR
jgi:hypothetical protein